MVSVSGKLWLLLIRDRRPGNSFPMGGMDFISSIACKNRAGVPRGTKRRRNNRYVKDCWPLTLPQVRDAIDQDESGRVPRMSAARVQGGPGVCKTRKRKASHYHAGSAAGGVLVCARV